MDGDEAFDEKAVIALVREQLRISLGQTPLSPSPQRPEAPVDSSAEALEAELAVMRATSDIGGVPLRSYRRLIGRFFSFARRVARKLIDPSLQQQVSYNAANYRLARALQREVEALRLGQSALHRRLDALEAALERARRESGRE